MMVNILPILRSLISNAINWNFNVPAHEEDSVKIVGKRHIKIMKKCFSLQRLYQSEASPARSASKPDKTCIHSGAPLWPLSRTILEIRVRPLSIRLSIQSYPLWRPFHCIRENILLCAYPIISIAMNMQNHDTAPIKPRTTDIWCLTLCSPSS